MRYDALTIRCDHPYRSVLGRHLFCVVLLPNFSSAKSAVIIDWCCVNAWRQDHAIVLNQLKSEVLPESLRPRHKHVLATAIVIMLHLHRRICRCEFDLNANTNQLITGAVVFLSLLGAVLA